KISGIYFSLYVFMLIANSHPSVPGSGGISPRNSIQSQSSAAHAHPLSASRQGGPETSAGHRLCSLNRQGYTRDRIRSPHKLSASPVYWRLISPARKKDSQKLC